MKPDYNKIVADNVDVPILKEVLQRISTVSGVPLSTLKISVDSRHCVNVCLSLTASQEKLMEVCDALMVKV